MSTLPGYKAAFENFVDMSMVPFSSVLAAFSFVSIRPGLNIDANFQFESMYTLLIEI